MKRCANIHGLVLLCFLAAAAGCKARAEPAQVLPAASGSALPPPAIPKLSEIAEGSTDAAPPRSSGPRGTGTLHPREAAELGPKATGIITKILVDEGDQVKKGQLLFTLDAAHAGLGVEQAQAGLTSARVNLQAAELDFKRTKELLDRGSIPPATFDQVKARYDSARAGVQQAELAVSQARRTAADTSVHAPFSGVVTAKLKNVGEIATMTPASVVLVVQDLSKLELRARLPERVLKHLAQGDPIDIHLPALEQKRTVDILRINPTIDARTRTVEIVAEVDNADGRLRAGMLAEVLLRDGASDAAPPPARAAVGKKP